MLSCHYGSFAHPNTFTGYLVQYPFFVYKIWFKKPTFYFKFPAYFLASCFNFIYFDNIAYLWLLFAKPWTNLSRTA